MKKKNFLSYAKNITENKKQRDFIVHCLAEGQVTNKMIDKLFEKAKKYKHLLKNNDISIDKMITEKEEEQLYSKTFENINDEVEKSIILNKSKKLFKICNVKKTFSPNKQRNSRNIFCNAPKWCNKKNVGRRCNEKGCIIRSSTRV